MSEPTKKGTFPNSKYPGSENNCHVFKVVAAAANNSKFHAGGCNLWLFSLSINMLVIFSINYLHYKSSENCENGHYIILAHMLMSSNVLFCPSDQNQKYSVYQYVLTSHIRKPGTVKCMAFSLKEWLPWLIDQNSCWLICFHLTDSFVYLFDHLFHVCSLCFLAKTRCMSVFWIV